MHANFKIEKITLEERQIENAAILKCNEDTEHKKVLANLLNKVKAVDFLSLSGVPDPDKIKNRHYLIIVIEEILRLAQANKWGLCRRHDFIYLFNGAYWDVLEPDELKSFLGKAAEKMGVEEFKAKHFAFRDQLFKQFIALGNLPGLDQPKDRICINLKNGTFIITPQTRELLGFNLADFMTYQLPFDYDPFATAPQFMAYLNRCIPDEQKQNVIAEFLGYIFTRPTTLKLEKTLMLYGSGANGKSVLYEVVRNLLGEHNVSEYSLQSLTDSKGYHRANLANKLVNYASEINGKLESSIFKQLVSGEPVEARLPYGNPFILQHYAKLIFNCNELPKDVEQTEAYFRRFLIITFDTTIPEHEQDKELAQKIVKAELSGIFNWVLAGLERLLAQKQFTYCASAQQARKQYEIDSDSVQQFLNSFGYLPHSISYIRIKELYFEYRDFCTDEGCHPLKKINFKKRLKTLGITIEPRNVGDVAFLGKYEVD